MNGLMVLNAHCTKRKSKSYTDVLRFTGFIKYYCGIDRTTRSYTKTTGKCLRTNFHLEQISEIQFVSLMSGNETIFKQKYSN